MFLVTIRSVHARKYSKTGARTRSILEYLILGEVRARKYSKTGARTRSILKKIAFDTTLVTKVQKKVNKTSYFM